MAPRTRCGISVRGVSCAGTTLVGAARCTISLPPNGPGRHSVVTVELPGVGPAHTGCDKATVAVRSGSASTSIAARAGHGACEGVLEMGEAPAALACWRTDP